MKPRENEKAGPVTHFLIKDHRRLENLLQSAVTHADQVDRGAYSQFRAGLLRHIGIEEKILLPAAQRLRGGEPLLIASKLRLDHGAPATLLMPTPAAPIIDDQKMGTFSFSDRPARAQGYTFVSSRLRSKGNHANAQIPSH